MGTSTRWGGPRGGQWRQAARVFGRGQIPIKPEPEHDSVHVGEKYLAALHAEFQKHPTTMGLRDAMYSAGERLIQVCDAITTHGPTAVGELPGDTPQERLDAFRQNFVDAVAGQGGLLADVMVRRAACRSVERLLNGDNQAFKNAVIHPGTAVSPLSGELFCALFRWFFADVVREFIAAMIAENVKVVVPVLTLDPTGLVAHWIAEQVVALLPNPCEHVSAPTTVLRPLSAVARELVTEAVNRALGITSDGMEAA